MANEQWTVWVVDHIERTAEAVLFGVDMWDANTFKSVWTEPDSQVVILPSGFEIINESDDEPELETEQNELNSISINTGN